MPKVSSVRTRFVKRQASQFRFRSKLAVRCFYLKHIISYEVESPFTLVQITLCGGSLLVKWDRVRSNFGEAPSLSIEISGGERGSVRVGESGRNGGKE